MKIKFWPETFFGWNNRIKSQYIPCTLKCVTGTYIILREQGYNDHIFYFVFWLHNSNQTQLGLCWAPKNLLTHFLDIISFPPSGSMLPCVVQYSVSASIVNPHLPAVSGRPCCRMGGSRKQFQIF